MLNAEKLEKEIVKLEPINVDIDIYCYNEYKVTPYSLFLLENISNVKKNCTILDFGSGTGIIAIACYYLKIKQIYAYDINSIGIELTKYNIAVNNAGDINIIDGKSLLNDMPTLDLILSNPPSLPCEHKTSDFFYGGYFGTNVIFEMIDIGSCKIKKGGTLEFVLTSLVSQNDVKNYLAQRGFNFLICDQMNLTFRNFYFDMLPHFEKLKSQGKCNFFRDDKNQYYETLFYVKAEKL